MNDIEKKAVEDLIVKSAQTSDARDAQMFSQAALNAAHAAQVMSIVVRITPPPLTTVEKSGVSKTSAW